MKNAGGEKNITINSDTPLLLAHFLSLLISLFPDTYNAPFQKIFVYSTTVKSQQLLSAKQNQTILGFLKKFKLAACKRWQDPILFYSFRAAFWELS